MSSQPQHPINNPQPNRTPRLIAITIALVIGVSALVIASVYLFGWRRGGPAVSPTVVAQVSPVATRVGTPVGTPVATTTGTPATPLASPGSITPTSITTASTDAEATLRLLDSTDVPRRDLYSITARLKLKSTTPLPTTTGKPPGNYQVGHTDTFSLNSPSERRYYTVTATIRKVTSHAYWYTQDDKPVDANALEAAADTFDQKIYPTNRSLFGSEWTPGVDNDPRITVLFADIPGVGGYFSSADEYTRAVNPFSNEREMIYINTGGGWYGVENTLAHEFQHMIHWNESTNHDVWLNEGMAELASALNGYDVNVDRDFMADADVQLNAWRASANESIPHYGAAFLFLDFVRAHYGGSDILRDIVSAPGRGTDALDNALKTLGREERFKDVFERWAIANLVDGQDVAIKQGLDYPDREVSVSPHVRAVSYPKELNSDVSQFGTDYIELGAPGGSGALQVQFRGDVTTSVIGTAPHSGSSIWWSNRGDVSNSGMTRAFDLRNLQSATLDFYAWYDIENNFDFAYVEASTDGGKTWDSLKGAYTTAENPNGTNQGNGFTGKSAEQSGANGAGWVRESLDLSAYAGKEVAIRFEYITDDGYNAQGFAVDDISIPELGYTDDAESASGWQSAGFVRIQNTLPQRYYLAAVKLKKGDAGFDVQRVEVGPSGSADFAIEGLGTTYEKAVLLVAGETPHTLLKAKYSLTLKSNP